MTATLETNGDDLEKAEAVNDETTPVAPVTALRLPAHLIARVFSQLDCVDLLSCSLVCRQWYIESAELREGWKNEYIEAWKLYGLGIKQDTHPPSSTCSIRDLPVYQCHNGLIILSQLRRKQLDARKMKKYSYQILLIEFVNIIAKVM